MGVYLTTPNTEKDTEEGSYKSLKYAACSMQGNLKFIKQKTNKKS